MLHMSLQSRVIVDKGETSEVRGKLIAIVAAPVVRHDTNRTEMLCIIDLDECYQGYYHVKGREKGFIGTLVAHLDGVQPENEGP